MRNDFYSSEAKYAFLFELGNHYIQNIETAFGSTNRSFQVSEEELMKN